MPFKSRPLLNFMDWLILAFFSADERRKNPKQQAPLESYSSRVFAIVKIRLDGYKTNFVKILAPNDRKDGERKQKPAGKHLPGGLAAEFKGSACVLKATSC
jgi:hypothetical protein